MRCQSYIASAITILSLYKGEMPLAAWLKNYFKQHKKFGSKDRKVVADLCFSYYRLGKAWSNEALEERILISQFLCNDASIFIKDVKPEWLPYSTLSVEEKMQFLSKERVTLFPFEEGLSSEIDRRLFSLSFLVQPDLFLRIRPKNKNLVIQKLTEATLAFAVEGDCIRLSNMSKIDDVLEIDKEVVVQDKSSQQVLNALTEKGLFSIKTSWDCCAASGGKSILLHDHFAEIQLTVSDIRESILHNLRSRFKKAGIQQYQSFVADVATPSFSASKKYDLIICDAPCSGSGTWSRTPEQLFFFEKNKIEYYAGLQKAISFNVVKALKKGSLFLYITCSVFKKENEEVVMHLLKETSLQLIDQRYYKGYKEKADTLFTALFLL